MASMSKRGLPVITGGRFDSSKRSGFLGVILLIKNFIFKFYMSVTTQC